MDLYQGIKDVAKVLQQADNIELYKKLLDLCKQALDMQAEVERLTRENRELREAQELKTKIIRHDEPFITLEGHPDSERFCTTCYGREHVLIQVRDLHNGYFSCPSCQTGGIYDPVIVNKRREDSNSIW